MRSPSCVLPAGRRPGAAADGLSQRLAAAQPGVHTRDYASLIRTPRPKAREARVPGHTIVVGAAFSGTLVAASHTQGNSVGSVSVNPRREPAAIGGQARRAERPSPSIHTMTQDDPNVIQPGRYPTTFTGAAISPGVGMGPAWLVVDPLKAAPDPAAIARDQIAGERS